MVRLHVLTRDILLLKRSDELKSSVTEALESLVWRTWIPCESDSRIEERLTTILHMTADWERHKELLLCHAEISAVRMYFINFVMC